MSIVPDGTPLVLLNAFPVDRSQWDPLVDALAGRVPGDIITFDVPGIGDMPLPDEEPSVELIADAAVLAMREVTGHPAAVWVGCSMGGYIAMAVAERHPEAVAGLGLLGTRSTADTDEARAGRLAIAEKVDGAPGHPDPRGAAEGLVGTQGDGREALVATVAANIALHEGDGIAWGQRAMAARPDRTEVLRALDVPAFVAVGENDGIAGPAEAAVMADALGVDPVVLGGVGHLCALEAPGPVADLVTGLLDSV
ncbi:alpha/beta fold hydrolase [Demequina lignilytica]|uniref:Alpha/beta hydrolase n=1 Tax=Demequina lignilytica TaxID=3051663 RepID=A0AAW7M569_9MICO|nr:MULTISPECIES: alpha/beta hydrolase [unclassified Demequina]MDN4479110.1 alpha/beta hydrolase [Demequina sp. SYSU T00039-1]MDN4482548.1 alpha/beta hydrolase [Demequina sp. SYSU T0a273]MDN4489177.1 alpha/beta hydrolase [Demequina sp. SYSU T00039]MDN4490280.1 alpha/beta hydrolase [Demequina sp. SYSU T00068]